jgi:hypothetical protein
MMWSARSWITWPYPKRLRPVDAFLSEQGAQFRQRDAVVPYCRNCASLVPAHYVSKKPS